MGRCCQLTRSRADRVSPVHGTPDGIVRVVLVEQVIFTFVETRVRLGHSSIFRSE